MHDKSVYEVEYPDVTMEKLIANIISETIISLVDSEGHHYQLLTGFTDHKIDGRAISKVDVFIESSNGNLHRNRKTCCWKLLVECKDG